MSKENYPFKECHECGFDFSLSKRVLPCPRKNCPTEPQQDPVVDKSLEQKAEKYAKTQYPFEDVPNALMERCCAKADYLAGAKESKSKAIADFILELQKKCAEVVDIVPGQVPAEWGRIATAHQLLGLALILAEELKDKI